MPELVSRRVTGHAEEFLDAFRIVIVNGPRQSGKTTLLRQLNGGREGTYLTLDDGSLRSAAQADSAVFIADGARPMMIDEIHLSRGRRRGEGRPAPGRGRGLISFGHRSRLRRQRLSRPRACREFSAPHRL